MLIEQIIEFKVRGHGPCGRTCTPVLVIFMTKQKYIRNIFAWIILLFTSTTLQAAMYIVSPPWAK